MATKTVELLRMTSRLERLGIQIGDIPDLIRIERTLSRWFEQECGDSNEYGSWAIERDDQTEKPYKVIHHFSHGTGPDRVTRYPIPDREAGARRRLAKIMEQYPELVVYVQTDPRGCALYIVKRSDLSAPDRLDSEYTKGVAVCY